MVDRRRNRARAWALQALYAWEMRGAPPEAMIGILREISEQLQVAPENRLYADVLVRLVAENLTQLDRLVEEHLSNWRLERLSAVDRNLLRLGAAELLFLDDVPPIDTVRGLIQLAGNYGTPDSPRFINGVLDALVNVTATRRALERGGRR